MSISTTIAQTQTVAESPSGWSGPLSFAQFDPSLGTLVDVRVGITGDAQASAAIENLGATSAEVLINVPSSIAVTGPGNAYLTAITPEPYQFVDLGAFDGSADFAGTSGTIVSGLSNAATIVSVYSPGTAGLTPFVGTGSIDLTATSQSSVAAYAYGNLLSLTQVQSGATITVQYDYLATGGGSGSAGGGGGSSGEISEIGIVASQELFTNSQTTAVQTIGIADTRTGWNTALAANEFNPALGTLEAVNVTLISDINAGFAVENLGSAAASVSMADTAYVTLTLPGTIGVVTMDPAVSSTPFLSAFDGTIDFAGPSGLDVSGLTNTQTTTTQLNTFNDDLSSFIGAGTVALPVQASSPSTLTGPADLASELLTNAGATLEISYVYIANTSSNVSVGVGAPTISGATNTETFTGQPPIAPFGNLVITDPNAGQTENVTVTLSSATNGTLTVLGNGTYNAGTGIYTDTGSAAAVTTDLNNLVFTPAGNDVITDFTISDTDTAGASAADATTSVTTTPEVTVNIAAAAAAITNALDPGTASQSIACFAAGTRIATPGGAIRVERLQAGDSVLTISGQEQAIEWIGRRTLDCRRHPTPERVRPVRIAAHAFGENRPTRPLLLSPDHSVFVEDVLIPVKFLINGTTIVRTNPAAVTYYHLELSRHDVVLAEGLPTETYLETGGRSAFQNGGAATQLHPDFAPDEARVGMVWRNFSYAPLIGTDGQLDRVRARLACQALMLGSPTADASPAAARAARSR